MLLNWSARMRLTHSMGSAEVSQADTNAATQRHIPLSRFHQMMNMAGRKELYVQAKLIEKHGLSAHMANLGKILFLIIELSHIHPLFARHDRAQGNIRVDSAAQGHKTTKNAL